MCIWSCLTKNFGFLTQSGFSSPSVVFDRISNQFSIWFGFREKNDILGLKNENPCFENFSGVSGSWFRLEGGEESQGFTEVKH